MIPKSVGLGELASALSLADGAPKKPQTLAELYKEPQTSASTQLLAERAKAKAALEEQAGNSGKLQAAKAKAEAAKQKETVGWARIGSLSQDLDTNALSESRLRARSKARNQAIKAKRKKGEEYAEKSGGKVAKKQKRKQRLAMLKEMY
ncbi:unnamed protein product [Chrysoparadoxa australica]